MRKPLSSALMANDKTFLIKPPWSGHSADAVRRRLSTGRLIERECCQDSKHGLNRHVVPNAFGSFKAERRVLSSLRRNRGRVWNQRDQRDDAKDREHSAVIEHRGVPDPVPQDSGYQARHELQQANARAVPADPART